MAFNIEFQKAEGVSSGIFKLSLFPYNIYQTVNGAETLLQTVSSSSETTVNYSSSDESQIRINYSGSETEANITDLTIREAGVSEIDISAITGTATVDLSSNNLFYVDTNDNVTLNARNQRLTKTQIDLGNSYLIGGSESAPTDYNVEFNPIGEFNNAGVIIPKEHDSDNLCVRVGEIEGYSIGGSGELGMWEIVARMKDPIAVVEGDSFTLSLSNYVSSLTPLRVGFYTSNYDFDLPIEDNQVNFVERQSSDNGLLNITAPANSAYMFIFYLKEADVMLNRGSEALPFIPSQKETAFSSDNGVSGLIWSDGEYNARELALDVTDTATSGEFKYTNLPYAIGKYINGEYQVLATINDEEVHEVDYQGTAEQISIRFDYDNYIFDTPPSLVCRNAGIKGTFDLFYLFEEADLYGDADLSNNEITEVIVDGKDINTLDISYNNLFYIESAHNVNNIIGNGQDVSDKVESITGSNWLLETKYDTAGFTSTFDPAGSYNGEQITVKEDRGSNNLCARFGELKNKDIDSNGELHDRNYIAVMADYIECQEGDVFTIQLYNTVDSLRRLVFYDKDGNLTSRFTSSGGSLLTVITPVNSAKMLPVYAYSGDVMLNRGSEALPFEQNGKETAFSTSQGLSGWIIADPTDAPVINPDTTPTGNNSFVTFEVPEGETRTVIFKNSDGEQIASAIVVGSEDGTASINLKPIGKLIFDFKDDEYDYSDNYVDDNLADSLIMIVYNGESTTLIQNTTLIKYANAVEGGDEAQAIQLRPTYNIPYYGAYPTDYASYDDGDVVRNPLNGNEPFSNLIDNCIKGAMVKFFNSKAGYSYLRFDEAFNYNLSSSALSGAVYQQNSVADNTIARGYEGERAFVCKGQFSAEYLGMIDALMVSPEVYLYGYWLDNRFFLADDTDNEFSYFRVREMETNAVSEKSDGSQVLVNITFLLAESNTFKLY